MTNGELRSLFSLGEEEPQITQISQMSTDEHRLSEKHKTPVITYVVAKRLCRRFFGVQRPGAALQKRWQRERLSVSSMFSG